ncbi:CapA family protein [Algoriphagus sp. NG3]|uniref:CapA family protein n=1 Tax=unclassified Algoriphagus TaxID=2641541 RepID=UPI002A83C060|nr:CapA family protein [Algoriphagus sp. NG3]WPR77826.1 CapA family protein [Algoriphagus sp. NG3]
MKLTVFGDLVEGGRVCCDLLSNKENGILADFSEILQSSDFNVFNLEAPILRGGFPIKKVGPVLKNSPELIHFLKKNNLNIASLANNHIMDFGDEGLNSTLKLLRDAGLLTVGGGEDQNQAEQPLILEKESLKIGVINAAEHEFSLAKGSQGGANYGEILNLYYQIKSVKNIVDWVVLIYHGGNEHYPLPSPRLQDYFRFFVDAGADVVIGHHQHCHSGYESYGSGLIFYGIGNFIFDKIGRCNDQWNYGFGVALDFSPQDVKFDLLPYNQFSKEPKVKSMSSGEKKVFEERIKHYNAIINDRKALEREFEAFCSGRSFSVSSKLEPFDNRLLTALRRRGLAPSFLSEKKILHLYNYLLCRSHMDVVEAYLEKQLERIKTPKKD